MQIISNSPDYLSLNTNVLHIFLKFIQIHFKINFKKLKENQGNNKSRNFLQGASLKALQKFLLSFNQRKI